MSDYPDLAARAAHGTDGQNAVRPDRSDESRCISVHWSVPVQCVLPVGHRENWHEAWHPKSRNRLRYRRSMGGYHTEELHHGEWHDLQLPPPGGFCGLLRSDSPTISCTEQYGHGWTHRAKVDGVQHTWNTVPASGLSVDQLTRDVTQLRGMVVAAHVRIAELEAEPSLTAIITWLFKKAREYEGVTDRQETASQVLARMADKLSRGAVPARNAANAVQHFDKVPDPLDGCHWCACGKRWPCKDAAEVTS